jgi:hypothetical protein
VLLPRFALLVVAGDLGAAALRGSLSPVSLALRLMALVATGAALRLDSKANRFVLGIEDIALASGLSDKHFNDQVVSPSGISLGLF